MTLRLTEEQLQAIKDRFKKAHEARTVTKYNNKRVHTPEGWFDSQRELKRWEELKLLAKAGKIQNLERQVKFELIPKLGKLRATHFVADFVYEENGRQVVEDSKGYRNRLYMLKAKLMQFRHGIVVLET